MISAVIAKVTMCSVRRMKTSEPQISQMDADLRRKRFATDNTEKAAQDEWQELSARREVLSVPIRVIRGKNSSKDFVYLFSA
jgi:hypothetical protein